MENNLELEATQEAYQKAVNGLVKKTKFLSLCFLAFFVFLKIASKEMTFFEAVEGAFGFTICMYLPFKICHQITGTIGGTIIGGIILLIVLALFVGNRNVLFSLILIGGMLLDFGWSIAKVRKLKKVMTPENGKEI